MRLFRSYPRYYMVFRLPTCLSNRRSLLFWKDLQVAEYKNWRGMAQFCRISKLPELTAICGSMAYLEGFSDIIGERCRQWELKYIDLEVFCYRRMFVIGRVQWSIDCTCRRSRFRSYYVSLISFKVVDLDRTFCSAWNLVLESNNVELRGYCRLGEGFNNHRVDLVVRVGLDEDLLSAASEDDNNWTIVMH